MELRLFVIWTMLLAAGLALVLPSVLSLTTSLKAPQLISCVFYLPVNVACKWTPGDSQTTNYTLTVQRTTGDDLSSSNSSNKTFTCTTSNTNCTVKNKKSSVNFNFCISITAHGPSGSVTSKPRCQLGKIEVMLNPAILNNITPVDGNPRCLTLNWSRGIGFPISLHEMRKGHLESEIEFKPHGQPGVQVSNVAVNNLSFEVCLFKPDTEYTVRLRHRYKSSSSPWSPWSNAAKGNTVEDAPSAAPMFWRQQKERKNRYRLTSLLWKPLPHSLANGRVLFYNVTCQTENLLPENGNCSNLDHSQTSCSLFLPIESWSCALSASTSAGTSPKTWLWSDETSEMELPSLSQMTVTPVDNNSLRILWAPLPNLSLSGFIVEWFVVRQKNERTTPHWERLKSSSTMTIITEGVEPFERYAVSVRALYSHRGAGQSRTEYVYTRQGVPSAGPTVRVKSLGLSVELSWMVPVEHLHGFIQNYILHYNTTNQPAKSVNLSGNVEQYSLQLSPGLYEFYMQASTEAGIGVKGPSTTAHIVSEEISVLLCVILPLAVILSLLVLMVCVAQSKLVKVILCQNIPDPSNSSLAHWSPKATTMGIKLTKPEMKYSEVVLLSEFETDNTASDPDLRDKSACYVQTYSPVAATSPSAFNFSSCPSIYSTVLVSKTPPAPVLQQCNDKHHSSPSVYDKLQLGGVSEPYISLRDISTRGLHSTLFPKTTSHPLALFSQDGTIQPFCAASPQHLLTLNYFTSVPLLQSDTFSPAEPPHLNASTSCSPFFNSVFMDLSQSTMECDPYRPA